MAMADIASQSGSPAVPLSQIAERQNLPLAYLEQLFVLLRRAGLVESTRGRSGGYKLAKPARRIAVADVMAAVEEGTRFTSCSESDARCSRETPCLTHGLWASLSSVTANFLASTSLEDVVLGHVVSQAANEAERHARVYLDYNATAPVLSEARAAAIAALDISGNPSSAHKEGRRARALVETARESVARLVNCKASEVVFTSGATESNAWVLAQPWDTVFVAGIEHDSVLAPLRASGANIIELGVLASGRVRTEDFAAYVLSGAPLGRALLILQAANNETGVIQDVASAAAFARDHGIFVHTDAVQAAGRIPLDFAGLGADTMSLSAHKLGGLKGVGALIVRDHLDLAPLIRGGGQERRRRSGTENIAAIAGFGAAAKVAAIQLAGAKTVAELRDSLEAEIRRVTPDAVIVGRDAPRLANTSAIGLPGAVAETLVIRLDLLGFAVSAGSACSSGKVGRSHVLDAMGLGGGIAGSTIRVSLGPETTAGDISAFIAAWSAMFAKSTTALSRSSVNAAAAARA